MRIRTLIIACGLWLALLPPARAQDPGTFLNWLNAQRAVRRLPAVTIDPNLSAWCQRNNEAQRLRGLGHWILGPIRRQNSAWSPGGFGPVPALWMASPPHRAALLDPYIRKIGIAGLGAYFTFDCF